MNRITPEEVVEAYRSTGLTPRGGSMIRGDFACAIGALYVYRTGHRGFALEVSRWAEKQVASVGYLRGFCDGFDDMPKRWNDHPASHENYDTGFTDGRECRIACHLPTPQGVPHGN